MATNNIKAMYPINLKNDGQTDSEKNVYNVNQERLNDNFRTIMSELTKLWESGERNLNVLSARISNDEKVFVTYPDAQGIAAREIENSTIIQAIPGTIYTMLAQVISGYINDQTEPTDNYENAIYQVIKSLIETKTATYMDATFQMTTTKQTADGNASYISDISNWIRDIAAGLSAGVDGGVIIGQSDVASSLKAEAGRIFFYQGADEDSKWANALAGLNAQGRFFAANADLESVFLGGMFDMDVVDVNGVNFLHITGR